MGAAGGLGGSEGRRFISEKGPSLGAWVVWSPSAVCVARGLSLLEARRRAFRFTPDMTA